MGVTVDYRVGTAPSSPVLIDYAVPFAPSSPLLADYLSTKFVATTIQTDYAIVDNVSALRAYTPVRTYILVVEHYEASCLPIGANIGEGYSNIVPVGVSIRSTEYNIAVPVGLAVSSTEDHPALPISAVIGTEFSGTALPISFAIGTPGAGTVPISMNVESVKRRLDVEVSIVTEEQQEVEEEP